MKFQPTDIVLTTPEYGEKEFVILAVENDKYYAANLKTKKRYRLTEEQITTKVGQVSPDDPILQTAYYNPEDGRKYARQQVQLSDKEEQPKWQYLSELNPGDEIEVAFKKFRRPAIFIQVNLKKPRLVFRAKVSDVLVDLPLEALYIQTKT